MMAYPETDPDATLNDHIYMCQYIKVLADSSDLFMWDKGDDQLAIINQLVDAYQQSQNNPGSSGFSMLNKSGILWKALV